VNTKNGGKTSKDILLQEISKMLRVREYARKGMPFSQSFSFKSRPWPRYDFEKDLLFEAPYEGLTLTDLDFFIKQFGEVSDLDLTWMNEWSVEARSDFENE
jgi:hypothetical protein